MPEDALTVRSEAIDEAWHRRFAHLPIVSRDHEGKGSRQDDPTSCECLPLRPGLPGARGSTGWPQ
jgi:hypothetical protein